MAVETPGYIQTLGYDANFDRLLLQNRAVQPGVFGGLDFACVGTGGMNVLVAAGFAWVAGTASSGQGIYGVRNNGSFTITIPAADSSNPRLDQIVLRVYDANEGGGSGTSGVEVIQGTPVSGTTLDSNSSSRAALPANCLRLADVLVAAGSTSVVSTVRDRRPFARGFFRNIVRNSADYVLATTAVASIDATNLRMRVECTGVPLRITLQSPYFEVASKPRNVTFGFDLDGVAQLWAQYSTAHEIFGTPSGSPAGNYGRYAVYAQYTYTPTAGSHVFTPIWQQGVGASVIGLAATVTFPLRFTIEELMRQDQHNGAS